MALPLALGAVLCGQSPFAQAQTAGGAVALAPPANIDRSPARLLTLDEALDLARKNNRDLRAAQVRLRISHADVERAVAVLMPKLNAQGKYTFNYPEAVLNPSDFLKGVQPLVDSSQLAGQVIQDQILTGQYRPSPAVAEALAKAANMPTPDAAEPTYIVRQHQLDAVIAATLPLLAAPAYPALSGAKHAYAAQKKQLQATEAQLLQSVASAFYAAAGTDEMVAARRHAIEVSQKTLDNARARLEAGVVNRVEVTRAELALLQAQQRLLEAEDARGSAYRVLDTLLLLRTPFHVQPPQEAPAEVSSDGELVTEALRQRPEVSALESTIRATQAQALSQGLRWLPTLSAFGNIRVTNAKGFTGRYDSYAAGVQLDWQLFDGFERDAQRHIFEAQSEDAKLRLKQLRDTITDDVQNARRASLTRREGLKSAQRQVQLARETLELVRIQHDAGTATQLDLLTAQDQLMMAEVGQAQARFDLSLADIGLRRLVGRPFGAAR